MKITRVPTIVAFVILLLSGCSKSFRNVVSYDNIVNSERKHQEEHFSSDEEGAVQEPAWTYFERLSYLFGADSTCVGMRDDMNFPEWYSGCFFNDRNRLTINVVGDTAEIRDALTRQLGGNEFDLGIGVCSIKEQIKTKQLLKEAVAQKYNGDFQSGTNPDGTIDICLQGNSDSIISNFKRDIFDAPILRFTLADKIEVIAISNPEGYDSQEEMYVEHETTPQFPGDDAAMLSYIYDNLTYPQNAYDKNIQGRVVLRFLVHKSGEVDSIKIIKGIDPSLDAEAMRLVSGFPQFKPATFDLEPVDWHMAFPIKFNKADYDERHSKRYSAFQFDNGDDYIVDGMYRIVDEQGRIGYANEKGNTVITPRFKFAYPFEGGKARVTDSGIKIQDGEHWFWDSNDWYFIDKTGRKID